MTARRRAPRPAMRWSGLAVTEPQMLVDITQALGAGWETASANNELDALAQVYAEALAKAQALWTTFTRYCTEQEQITLTNPTLWITPTEVA